MSKIKVGVAQVAPKFLDKKGTVEKACKVIGEAGKKGVQLLVFPETFIAAFPYWRGCVSVRRSTELIFEMQKNAIRIPGEDTEILADAAKAADLICVIGCNELSDITGSGTLYNTLLFINNDGIILGKHRKIMPTHSERVYWGMGDASDIAVFDTDIGRIGGAICYEHHMTLLRYAMAVKGEEIHCAVWPGWWRMEKHGGDKTAEPGARSCDIEPAIRQHAIETQTFVISSSGYLPPEEVPDNLKSEMQYNLGVGGACVVNPAGVFVREPVFNKEDIICAEIDMDERMMAKAYFDTMGHYARWDILSLNIAENRWTPTGPKPIKDTGEERAGDIAKLKELAKKYNINDDKLKSLINDLENMESRR